jgi:outer membrane lipoprotein-sorting protein
LKIVSAVVACAAIAFAVPAAAQSDLLGRMSALNPNLRTFSADMHVDAKMKSFPFVTLALQGTWYHQAPDKDKVVFTGGVPAVAQQFDKLYAHIEPPSRWRTVYDVKVVSDDGTVTTYRLTPLRQGNVDHVDVRASDRNATVQWTRWNYVNGGYAEMRNYYKTVDGTVVVGSQTGHVEEPGYTADIDSTVDDYKINVPLSPGTFAQ